MDTAALLHSAELTLVGQISDASNAVFLVEAAGLASRYAVYKPVRGERPLWDFPDGTLAGREYAAYLVSEAGGWHLVPATVLRDGPFGVGAVQRWIGDPFAGPGDHGVVDVRPRGDIPVGWLHVVDGQVEGGAAVSVVHSAAADVRAAAVFDAVVNNGDRKGSHLVRDESGRLFGFDHGVCFHQEPKLRTVLWGWAGEPLVEDDVTRLRRLDAGLGPTGELRQALEEVLPAADVAALADRVAALLVTVRHPQPTRGWPSIPWPVL